MDIKHKAAKVILALDNLEELQDIRNDACNGSIVLVEPLKKSVVGRWVPAIQHINTDTVLLLDSDVHVKLEALL